MVVAVTAVIGFQGWFNTYSSGVLTDVNQYSSSNEMMRVEGLIGDNLYLTFGSDTNLLSLKVTDNKGNEMCSFSGESNISSEGLVGWWTFDEGNGTVLYDNSGYMNHGELISSPKWVKTRLGYALKFDGIDDSVKILDNSVLDLANNSFALFAIFKPSKDIRLSSNTYPILLGKRPWMVGGYMIHFIRDNGGSVFQICYDSKCPIVPSEEILGDKIYRYLGQYVNLEMELYINSYLIGKKTVEKGMGSSIGENITIGHNYEGSIDEIRIYNRTLTSHEIRKLYWYSIRSMNEGINVIDLSNCNLEKGDAYNIILSTNEHLIDKTVINK